METLDSNLQAVLASVAVAMPKDDSLRRVANYPAVQQRLEMMLAESRPTKMTVWIRLNQEKDWTTSVGLSWTLPKRHRRMGSRLRGQVWVENCNLPRCE